MHKCSHTFALGCCSDGPPQGGCLDWLVVGEGEGIGLHWQACALFCGLWRAYASSVFSLPLFSAARDIPCHFCFQQKPRLTEFLNVGERISLWAVHAVWQGVCCVAGWYTDDAGVSVLGRAGGAWPSSVGLDSLKVWKSYTVMAFTSACEADLMVLQAGSTYLCSQSCL